jgi:4-hydroxy-tetrahydrodipicolinate synthase
MSKPETEPSAGRAFAPVLTPFAADLSPDAGRLIDHCRWLLSRDVGLAVFGTTSEGNSLSVAEKIDLLDALRAADVDLHRALPGTGCCALGDTVEISRHAVSLGCHGVLMLPPFYYKTVSDDGLYAYFSEVVQRVGDARLRIHLYHIPQVSGVGISPALCERLRSKHGEVIAGMKDSGGDWKHSTAVLDALAGSGFDFYCGSEAILLDTLRRGGAGCISATANVNPGAIAALCRSWRDPDAAEQQKRLDVIREIFDRRAMIAGLKAALAQYRDDPGWNRLRPPLMSLTAAAARELAGELQAARFAGIDV